MERELRTNGFLDLGAYGMAFTEAEAKAFFRESAFPAEAGLGAVAEDISVSSARLFLRRELVSSYAASVLADLVRQRLLETR